MGVISVLVGVLVEQTIVPTKNVRKRQKIKVQKWLGTEPGGTPYRREQVKEEEYNPKISSYFGAPLAYLKILHTDRIISQLVFSRFFSQKVQKILQLYAISMSLTHSLNHSLTHSTTHSLTHSLTHLIIFHMKTHEIIMQEQDNTPLPL